MPDQASIDDQLREIENLLKGLKAVLSGDALVEAQKPLLERRNALVAGSGTQIVGDENINLGVGAVNVGRDVGGDIVTGTKITYTSTPDRPAPLPLPQALQRYLDNIIDTHQHLRLQGIRAGAQPISVSLEKVYISLSAVDKQAPGYRSRSSEKQADSFEQQSGILTIPSALERYRRLVIIGDPGSGKTVLLSYLALTYARELRDKAGTVGERLQVVETDHLPVLLPLRSLGHHLQEKHPDPGTDGPAILLNYLHEYYIAQSIPLPRDFFNDYLERGNAVVLLDGMDEVAEKATRQRVARLVERFAVRYPQNRYIVTSREVGYEGTARIGAQFGLAKVREFSPEEVRRFVRDWTRVVETTLAGDESEDILRLADEQAAQLIGAIERNQRVSELAVNPLLLTVIALVHRYRARLPERRSELYEEAVEVLLARWDEAKGLQTEVVLSGRELDSGDRRSLLEPLAFWMHERERQEIERDELHQLLCPQFTSLVGGDEKQASKAVNNFLRLVSERSGLILERGIGSFSFVHLTFQEYLAARALADRADSVAYTLERLASPWWREVILLQAGYLSTQGTRRVSALVRAIMDADTSAEPSRHHHLLLAAECLLDVGEVRVEGNLLEEVKRRLRREADRPIKAKDRGGILGKVTAMNALSRIERGDFDSEFWTMPWLEPKWVTILAGEFWMGSENGDSDEKPVHKVYLDAYQISKVPITNAQYLQFITDTRYKTPPDWRHGKPILGTHNHPVVTVSWQDAMAYCRWLGEKTGKQVRLPTEAEWERAARGCLDQREYPWGNEWLELCCNSDELGLGDTTPVGLFLEGVSPEGVLDMAGNVWEWCQSRYQPYPYDPEDGREDLVAADYRVVRGGAFFYLHGLVRCARRRRDNPDYRNNYIGFRVVVSPFF